MDEPQLPDVGYDDRQGFIFTHSTTNYSTGNTAATISTFGGTSSGGSTQAGDPITGRHALAAHHFDRCNRTGLDRENLPGVQFYDDGTHGDLIPEDGIYSLSYLLDEEGSYNIRYFALGQTADGMDFARTRRISQYAGIQPDEDATEAEIQNMGTINGMINYAVYFLPKDHFGNYMGPGFKTNFKVSTSSGVLASELVDLNNGYYGQFIRYPQDSPAPTVTFTDKEDSFEKTIYLGKRSYEFIPFIGYTFFDNSLQLDDGIVVGARFGYRFSNRLTFELEGGATFTESIAGDSGHAIQALLNARYDLYSANTRLGQLTPYVTAGAGGVFFRGMGNDDNAFVYQGGVGATLDIKKSFDLRIDSRVFQFSDIWGAGSTTNFQITGGLVFRF